VSLGVEKRNPVSTAKIKPVVRLYLGNGAREDVSYCYLHRGVAYILSISTDGGNLEWRDGYYFPLFQQIR